MYGNYGKFEIMGSDLNFILKNISVIVIFWIKLKKLQTNFKKLKKISKISKLKKKLSITK